MKKRILSIFGTRPEAIKMAPVILRLRDLPEVFETLVCVTAQHREMLDQMLELFRIQPDIDLNLIQENQELAALTETALREVTRVLKDLRPEFLLVQGDTTTAMATALAGFYEGIPVGHVEAGLRTWNPRNPFPEESNRRIITSVASTHFAPTRRAREALLREGCASQSVFLTGNTGVDALQMVLAENTLLPRPDREAARPASPGARGAGKTILVTVHRRENFGRPLHNICAALKTLARRNPGIEMVFPVHLNPNLRGPVLSALTGCEGIRLLTPLAYPELLRLLDRCTLVLTDSGGLQEEAPALGKPVLVLRRETERPEVIEAGVARLVETEEEKIVEAVEALLHDPELYRTMSGPANPFGDGRAAERIVEVLRTGSCAEWTA